MEPPDEETEFCSNCQHDISASNFVMHRVHCERNIVLCDKCDEPVPRSQMGEHQEEYHVPVACECGQSFEKDAFEEHKEYRCKLRKVNCEFCELELAFEKMAEHSDFCGSRTEKCENCGQFIKIRDQYRHENIGCQAPPQEPAKRKVNNDPLVLRGHPFLRGENPFIRAGDQFQQFGLEDLVFPREELLSDAVAEPAPRASFVRQTVMEELDPETMSGQRRSRKNETTQRHNSKNERTVQARSSSVDEKDNDRSSHREQLKEDLLLAIRLAREEVEADGPALHPRLRHTSADPTPDELYRHLMAEETQGRVEENFVGPSSPPGQVPDSNEIRIPCEFCIQQIPLDTLEIHQTHCLQRDGDPSTPQYYTPDSDEEFGNLYGGDPTGRDLDSPASGNLPLNNLARPPIRAPFRNQVDDAVVTGNARNGVGSHGDSLMPDSEVSLVPCEFCDDQFPFVNIALHQASCDNAPQNRQIQDDMREYGFNDRGDGADSPPALPRVPREEQPALAKLPLAELIRRESPPSHRHTMGSYAGGSQNGQILHDMRESGLNDHGEDYVDLAALHGGPAEEPVGRAASPLPELDRMTGQPNQRQNQSGFGTSSGDLPDDLMERLFDLSLQPSGAALAEPVGPVPNGRGHSTAHPRKPANESLNGRVNRFGGAGATRGAAASGPLRASAPKNPERRMQSKHQLDPFFNHLEMDEGEWGGAKVNFVSRPKTLDMRQQSRQKKAQNKDLGRSQSFSAPTNVKSPNGQVFRRSPNSAFDRPTAQVVSTEKTLDMQRRLCNGGQQNQESFTTNDFFVDARANRNSRSNQLRRMKSDTSANQVRRPAGSRQLKTVDMLTETNPWGAGPRTTSSNSHSDRVKRTGTDTGSKKVSNADVASKERKSGLAARGAGQRSQRGGVNPVTVAGTNDEDTFKLSSQVILATRGKASPGVRDQDSQRRRTTDPFRGTNGSVRREKQQNGSGPSAESSANYSWQGMFSTPPINGTDYNSMEYDGRPGRQQQSFTRNGIETSSGSANPKGAASPSNHSPSDLLPASFRVNGASKEEGRDTCREGNQSRSKAGTRAAPTIEEDFTSKMISGTQALMGSSGKKTGEGRSTREPTNSQDVRRNNGITGPRCSANFGDGHPQQSRGHYRSRRGDRSHVHRVEKR